MPAGVCTEGLWQTGSMVSCPGVVHHVSSMHCNISTAPCISTMHCSISPVHCISCVHHCMVEVQHLPLGGAVGPVGPQRVTPGLF